LPVAVPVNASSLKYAGMYRVGRKTPLAHLCFLHCNVHITEACIGHWLGAEWFPAISVAVLGGKLPASRKTHLSRKNEGGAYDQKRRSCLSYSLWSVEVLCWDCKASSWGYYTCYT